LQTDGLRALAAFGLPFTADLGRDRAIAIEELSPA
jgi:hypothetical protein